MNQHLYAHIDTYILSRDLGKLNNLLLTCLEMSVCRKTGKCVIRE